MWHEVVEGYRQYLQSMNRSPQTIHNHRVRVRRFLAFIAARGISSLDKVVRTDIMAYQQHLAQELRVGGRINSVAVQNQHLSVATGFFRYLQLAELVKENPFDGIVYSREPKSLPKQVLSEREIKQLLKAPDLLTPVGFRDRTLLEVLYSTGLRKQEVMNLTMDDVDREAGFLTVRQGKGGKDRVVPIGRMACRYLSHYIQDIRPSLVSNGNGPDSRILFLSSLGRRLGKNAVNQAVERCRRRAGISRPISPHGLRHAFATHMVRHRANIRHVQEMLGHARLSTTQTYIRLTIVDLQAAHRKYHPREVGILQKSP